MEIRTKMGKIELIKREEGYCGEYLIFREYPQYDGSVLWTIENKNPELIGHLEKIRIGAWMSWCLTLEEGCYLSAGCQDEVREMTKILNSQKETTK